MLHSSVTMVKQHISNLMHATRCLSWRLGEKRSAVTRAKKSIHFIRKKSQPRKIEQLLNM